MLIPLTANKEREFFHFSKILEHCYYCGIKVYLLSVHRKLVCCVHLGRNLTSFRARTRRSVPPYKLYRRLVYLHSTVAHKANSIAAKENSITAKANWLRQKQIRNGKSNFVTAKANWKCNSQLVKVESKFVAAKANCTLRKCQTADEHRKSFRTKAKLDRHQSKIEQNQLGKVF